MSQARDMHSADETCDAGQIELQKRSRNKRSRCTLLRHSKHVFASWERTMIDTVVVQPATDTG
jgi:hypothetical protein